MTESRDYYRIVRANEFENNELEVCFRSACTAIVVEDHKFSAQLSSSIKWGNWLHKSAVLAGLGCLLTIPFQQTTNYIGIPLGAWSLTSATIYDTVWQFDPLCKYQVDIYGESLQNIPSKELTKLPDFTVFIRRDDTARKILHNTVGAIVLVVLGIKTYKLLS